MNYQISNEIAFRTPVRKLINSNTIEIDYDNPRFVVFTADDGIIDDNSAIESYYFTKEELLEQHPDIKIIDRIGIKVGKVIELLK